MQDAPFIEAKQTRSQQTQKKLLTALSDCLQEQFFEHISIAQLTEMAGVSVGTFYRRFKNKEALLPLLYQEFSEHLKSWVNTLEQQPASNLQSQVEVLVNESLTFLTDNAGVLRTLHLNARLYPEILTPEQLSTRSSEYKRMSSLLMAHKNEINHASPQEACDMVVFMLTNSLIDKVLYRDLTPAIASQLSLQDTCRELNAMLHNYLSH
ncbi:TetR/AcrR family transcriptional regulator [Thalassotalea euphylliae]|uniref:TetR/AcrR family transcriptional regulator n=1 Tax=Thalassotalea euphylliae TaxID=1655234 RepID=UPI003633CB11